MESGKKGKTKIQVKSPTQERSKQTVAAILEACAQLIVKEGYYAVTTDKIAETAGVSIGSLYQFFGNKESVVSALIKQLVEEDRKNFFDLLQPAKSLPPAERVQKMLEAGVEVYRVKHELRTALQTVRLYLTEQEYLSQARRILMDNLRASMPPLSPGRDVDKVVFITVTAFMSVMNNSLLDSPSLIDDPSLVKELMLMFRKYIELE